MVKKSITCGRISVLFMKRYILFVRLIVSNSWYITNGNISISCLCSGHTVTKAVRLQCGQSWRQLSVRLQSGHTVAKMVFSKTTIWSHSREGRFQWDYNLVTQSQRWSSVRLQSGHTVMKTVFSETTLSHSWSQPSVTLHSGHTVVKVAFSDTHSLLTSFIVSVV